MAYLYKYHFDLKFKKLEKKFLYLDLNKINKNFIIIALKELFVNYSIRI